MSAVPEDDLPANLVPESDLPKNLVPESDLPKDTYDPRDKVDLLMPAAGGATAAAIVPPMIKSGVKAVQEGRTAPGGALSRGPIVPEGHTPFNPRGVSVEQSLQNWKTYNEAQLEAAKKVRQESALHKKYPGFTRAGTEPVRAPIAPNATVAERLAAKVVPGGAADIANFAKGVYDYKLPFIGGIGSLAARGLVGAGAGMQAADAYNRAIEGDTTGSVISGIGSAGTAASLLPFLPAKVLGTGVGLSAEAINAYRDAMRKGKIVHGAPEDYSRVDAMGNAYADGGSVMPDISLTARELPNMTGMPGVGYMPTPAAVMANLQAEKELEKARLRAGLSALGMAIPGQHGVKVMPGEMNIGANIPVGGGNLDLSAFRSIAPVPGRGHVQGANVRYTLPFAKGGEVKKSDASIAGALRSVGERQGPNLSTMAKEYLAQLPEKTRQNIANTNYMVQNAMPYNPQTGQFDKGPTWNEFINYVPNLMGATAWHGTPHKFNKFSNEFIGSGEGHQAFGHGMYFAENPNIAKEYQKNLAGYSYNPQDLADYWKPGSIRKSYGGQDKVIAYDPDKNNVTVQAVVKDKNGEWVNDRQYPRPRVHATNPDPKEFKQAVGRDLPFAGSLYKVDIPDEHIPKMLDWDAPLSAQSKAIHSAVEQNNPDLYGHFLVPNTKSGEWLYQQLSDRLGGAKEASEYLNSLGIPGIKYADAVSRRTKEGTKNFVVFEPSEVKILERNNEPVGPLSSLE